MTVINHHFFLLDSKEYSFEEKNFKVDLNVLYETKEYLKFPDHLLLYMSDTLSWFPTYSSWKMKKIEGLNYYGDTIIKKNGAIKALEIFKAWAALFRCGAGSFEITGSYCYKPNSEEKGFYEKIKIRRDEVIKLLETLALYCDEVIKSNNEKFIWHFGI